MTGLRICIKNSGIYSSNEIWDFLELTLKILKIFEKKLWKYLRYLEKKNNNNWQLMPVTVKFINQVFTVQTLKFACLTFPT